MKRALLALFAFLLLTMPRAANAQVYGDFFYSSDGSAITITGYGGDGGQATIPDTIEDLPVTAIAEYAFIATSLTSLTLPGSVTSIGDEAFADCSSLTSLYFEGNAPACSWFAFEACPAVAYYQLGTTGWRTFTSCPIAVWMRSWQDFFYTMINGVVAIIDYQGGAEVLDIPATINDRLVTSIGAEAFSFCGTLTSVTMPVTVTNIGAEAFIYCVNLSSVTIPVNLLSLGPAAFRWCSLTNIFIPDQVINIGRGVFDSCHELSDITVDEDNQAYSSVDGVLFNKDVTTLVQYPPGKLGGYYEIPKTVTRLESDAFYTSWHLAHLAIPSSVTDIGETVFSFCPKLTGLVIPPGATNLGHDMFFNCYELSSVAIPESVLAIGSSAFFNCFALTNVNLPSRLTSIERATFFGCANLASLTIPGQVTTIGDMAFENCGLTNLTIPNSVTTLGWSALRGCTKLLTLTLGNSVISLGDSSLLGCSALVNLTLPASVASLGASALEGCIGLRGVYFRGNAPAADATAFNADFGTTLYYLPGTTNWVSPFAGRPARLWNPTPQTHDGGLGVGNNGFGFNISGTADIPIVVETSADLSSEAWIPLQSCTLSNGSWYFSDPAWTNHPARLYRIRSP